MRARVVAQFLCSTERSSSRVMHKNLRPVNLCIHRGHQFATPPPQKKKKSFRDEILQDANDVMSILVASHGFFKTNNYVYVV